MRKPQYRTVIELETGEANPSSRERIQKALEQALREAEIKSPELKAEDWPISTRFRESLQQISSASSSASTALTNVVTGLAIKVAFPEADVRYHQVQIQKEPWFNHRAISEKVVYPWLSTNDFAGAKSGWQTRTLERPKPYTMTYDENIGVVKDAFLACYDEMQKDGANNPLALAFFLALQIKLRENKHITLATPSIDDIGRIVDYFRRHINGHYGSKGASRLPVLALYAVYQGLIGEVSRYSGKTLLPLQEHSAADSQTGSVGDIQLIGEGKVMFEAVEVKHQQKVTVDMVIDMSKKIAPFGLKRYYVLTTHPECKPDSEMLKSLKDIRERIGCQIIVNGVLPTIGYYLRLLSDPSCVFPIYVGLLKSDKAISFEHRAAWNDVVHEGS